ncbi:hypothetical protein SKAU_G00275440 [Synaphobranchus kaupii]|uniref:Uncharacterized protein n=1 Tax=Synaphobranchus kaupii TaxID=118154 RepID=A0A9Q1F153_SYNKA|nr:hypothetical protein SKAU_G00275440 [Synaphobranchus kaupii]
MGGPAGVVDRCLRQKWGSHLHIYTDGSKDPASGRTGFALHIPKLQIIQGRRLTDRVTEIVALLWALEWVGEVGVDKAVLCSDSAAALAALQGGERGIGEQNREDGKSNEDSSEPQVSSSPQVEAPGAAEEGEWSREGTEADPDEEMSFDEEDFFSEFSQTDDAGDAALQAGNSLHTFTQGGVTRLKDLMHLEKGCWKPAVELAEILAVRSVRMCEQFLWHVKGCLPPSVLELIEETLAGGGEEASLQLECEGGERSFLSDSAHI